MREVLKDEKVFHWLTDEMLMMKNLMSNVKMRRIKKETWTVWH